MGATVFEIAGGVGGGNGPADPPWYKVWVPKGLVQEGLNKDYPGNESFTITLTDLWYFSIRS